LVDRGRTGHRDGRWRREYGHDDHYPDQAAPAMPRMNPA